MRNSKPFKKPKLLLVEGNDEVEFFRSLIKAIDLTNIDVRPMGGVAKLGMTLETIKVITGYNQVRSIGIVRDADQSFEGAFQSVCNLLEKNNYAVPTEPIKAYGEERQVSVFIFPDNNNPGMLEDLLLSCVEADPAMQCVESYFQCLANNLDELPKNIAKARVKAFLSSRELLEDMYFQSIQQCVETEFEDQVFANSVSENSIARANLFLASRYKPNLRIGEASKAGYWPYDHPNLASLKQFLEKL